MNQEEHPVVGGDGEIKLVQFNLPKSAAMLVAHPTPGSLDQDSLHRLRGSAEEVSAVGPGMILPGNAQPGFMNQGRGLECLASRLVGHPGGGEFAQLLIHQRQQLFRCSRFVPSTSVKNARHISHDPSESL